MTASPAELLTGALIIAALVGGAIYTLRRKP